MSELQKAGKTRPDKGSNKNGRERRLARIGAAFLVAVAAGWAIWLIATGKASSFVAAIAGADPAWVLAGMVCFAAYFLLDALCFRIAGALTGVRLGFADLVSVAAAGIVFGYLTPGQMGAAPAQIVRLTRAGMPAGDAGAVQLTRFFVYQSAVTIFGALMLAIKFRYIQQVVGNLALISALAFAVHLAIMAMLVAVVFFPALVRKVADWGVRLLGTRLHLIRNPQAALHTVDEQISQYEGSVHAAVRHAGVMVSAVVITSVQLVCVYAIAHCVLRALGVGGTDLLTNVACAAFVQLILTAVPLPGGTGGAEGGFALFFGGALGDLTGTGIVLWRLISFYLPVLVSFPLLAMRSSVGPAQRLETYGEAKVGRAAIAQDMHMAHERAGDARRQAGEKIDRAQQRIQERRAAVREVIHRADQKGAADEKSTPTGEHAPVGEHTRAAELTRDAGRPMSGERGGRSAGRPTSGERERDADN